MSRRRRMKEEERSTATGALAPLAAGGADADVDDAWRR
jgi:hypothetical protein